MGSFATVRFRSAGERSGRTANGKDWPIPERRLRAICMAERTFISAGSNGGSRRTAEDNRAPSCHGLTFLGIARFNPAPRGKIIQQA
jgi:hypothetical protein